MDQIRILVRRELFDPVWFTVQNRILKVKMWTFYFTCVVFSNWIVHSSGLMEIKSFHNFEFKTAIFEMQVQTWYFQSKIKWKYQIFRSILWYTFARLLLDLPSLIFWQKYSSVDIYSGRSLLISLRQDFSSSQKKICLDFDCFVYWMNYKNIS